MTGDLLDCGVELKRSIDARELQGIDLKVAKLKLMLVGKVFDLLVKLKYTL